jgi:paraquat-inducible protein B
MLLYAATRVVCVLYYPLRTYIWRSRSAYLIPTFETALTKARVDEIEKEFQASIAEIQAELEKIQVRPCVTECEVTVGCLLSMYFRQRWITSIVSSSLQLFVC